MDRTCDKCGKHIPHGSAYVCIAHNVEQMETDMLTLDDTVTVISSDELLILCGQCGNAFNAKAMKEIMNALSEKNQHSFKNLNYGNHQS